MIKIKSELVNSSGFKSTTSVLEITNYTMSQTVSLVTGSTMPAMAHTGKNINVNYLIYKSISDKNNGATPFQPSNFPFNCHFQIGDEEVVNESLIYNLVKDKLDSDGYTTEFI
jgi:hypothetical protein